MPARKANPLLNEDYQEGQEPAQGRWPTQDERIDEGQKQKGEAWSVADFPPLLRYPLLENHYDRERPDRLQPLGVTSYRG